MLITLRQNTKHANFGAFGGQEVQYPLTEIDYNALYEKGHFSFSRETTIYVGLYAMVKIGAFSIRSVRQLVVPGHFIYNLSRILDQGELHPNQNEHVLCSISKLSTPFEK